MAHSNTSSELALRFGADRVCAWRICGDRACLRARACRGDVLHCADLMGGWLAAIEEEQRTRGDLVALEDGLNHGGSESLSRLAQGAPPRQDGRPG